MSRRGIKLPPSGRRPFRVTDQTSDATGAPGGGAMMRRRDQPRGSTEFAVSSDQSAAAGDATAFDVLVGSHDPTRNVRSDEPPDWLGDVCWEGDE